MVARHIERRPRLLGSMTDRVLGRGRLGVGAAGYKQPYDGRVVPDVLAVIVVFFIPPDRHGTRRPMQRCPALRIRIVDDTSKVRRTNGRCVCACRCRPWPNNAEFVEDVANEIRLAAGRGVVQQEAARHVARAAHQFSYSQGVIYRHRGRFPSSLLPIPLLRGARLTSIGV
jgi:hypothetical protein